MNNVGMIFVCDVNMTKISLKFSLRFLHNTKTKKERKNK